jgi:transketolase
MANGPAAVNSKAIRTLVLEEAKRANVGHIGSGLSVADLIATLYGGVLRVESPDDPDRDRFVLSNGHAALALYSALHLRGWLTREELATYCADESLLGVHPEHELPGVDFSTGSLGQGISMAAGAALAARLQGSKRRVFAIVSDAECDEGSVWEAAMFSAQHRLANLVVIVDRNHQQALGYTRDVIDHGALVERWRAFGWDSHDADGHDVRKLSELIEGLDFAFGPPHVIVAQTTFGHGVSFMESRIEWHYLPMNDAQYAQARAEVEAMPS